MLLAPSPAFTQESTSTVLPPGWVPPLPTGLAPEPALLRKLMNASDGSLPGHGEPADGLYVETGHMITGAGWISAGPGYHRHLLDDRALVDVSAAVSWRLYKAAQARLEFPGAAHGRLALGAAAVYQDSLQVNYFGLGADSLESDRTAYRLNDTDVFGYATARATRWLSVSGRVGWIPRPTLSTATGPRVTLPNTLDRFSEGSAPGIHTQPAFLHGDVSITADWRDLPGHPTRGGLYRATAASYSDRDGGPYRFRRYELEGSQFLPLGTTNWILALHGWTVVSDASSGGVVPFYLMPSLGGQNTLRGYADYRFHDLDMESFSAESRWALFTHVDVAAFIDAGKVAHSASDLGLTHLRTSYGAGIRVHNTTSTVARLDIGHSVEGWRVFFKLTEPFNRSAPSAGRSAVMPFVP